MIDVAKSDETMKACPACGETILAVAHKCRYCQERLDGDTAEQIEVSNTVTTERTGKGWKGAELICLAVIFLGSPIFFIGMSEGDGNTMTAGIIPMIVGFISLAVVRFGVWWEHG